MNFVVIINFAKRFCKKLCCKQHKTLLILEYLVTLTIRAKHILEWSSLKKRIIKWVFQTPLKNYSFGRFFLFYIYFCHSFAFFSTWIVMAFSSHHEMQLRRKKKKIRTNENDESAIFSPHFSLLPERNCTESRLGDIMKFLSSNK